EAVPVLPRVEEGERTSRRRRRQVHAHDVCERNGEHIAPWRTVGLILLQLILGGEGETAQVLERADLRRLRPGRLELPAIEGTVSGSVPHLLADTRRLPPRHGGAGAALDVGLEVTRGHP